MASPQTPDHSSGSPSLTVRSKNFRAGEVLFKQGGTEKDAYIIQDGAVELLGTEGTIHDTAGKAAIVGEEVLLDTARYRFTARATKDTTTQIINDELFLASLSKLPGWLAALVKIAVSRMRDADKRVNQTMLRDRRRGLTTLLRLLYPGSKYEYSGRVALSYDLVVVEAYYICKFGRRDTEKLLSELAHREVITLETGKDEKRHICIPDPEVLSLYDEYLHLRAEKKSFREMSYPQETIAMLDNVAYVAQKSGTAAPEGTQLSKAALLEDLSDKNPLHLEKNLLDLRRRGLINLLTDGPTTTIVFWPEILSRIKKIKQWLPRFEAEIQ